MKIFILCRVLIHLSYQLMSSNCYKISPGAWFDPDMILVGNSGLSYEQSKSQFVLWSMLSAPLLMSNDLRKISPEFKEILLNKNIIAIDQDALGKMAMRVIKENDFEIWVKMITPIIDLFPSFAVVYFNRKTLGIPTYHSYTISYILVKQKITSSYQIIDLFDNKDLGIFKSSDNLTLRVQTSGSVRLVKLTPII